MRILVVLLAFSLATGCAASGEMRGGGIVLQFPQDVYAVVAAEDQTVDIPAVFRTPPSVLVIYPFGMSRAGITGSVLAKLTVDEKGSTRDVAIERASQMEFIPAVLFGLQKSVFFPAIRAGHAVPSTVWCEVLFKWPDERKEAQQVARANDHSRHASCYRMKTAEKKSNPGSIEARVAPAAVVAHL